MISFGMRSKIVQYSYQKNYDKLVKDLLANSNGKVFLDIGSGLGFLNPLVEKYKGRYVGLEPREDALQFARDKYNSECFFKGFFPDDLPENISKQMAKDENGGVIVSLTTLDEVPDKDNFLQDIYNLSQRSGKVFIAVRNKNWLLSRNSDVSNEFGDCLEDLSIEQYRQLFLKNKFDIIDIVKAPRPLITSFTINGIKNFVIRIIEKFISVDRAYMIGFMLKKSKN